MFDMAETLLVLVSGFLVKHKLADNVNSLRPQIVIEDTEHEKDRKGSVNSEVPLLMRLFFLTAIMALSN